MKTILTSLLIMTVVTSCVYPTSTVRVTDDRPTITIQGAPEDAVLYVDGLSMGSVGRFDGDPEVLLLEPGTHKIEITSSGKVLLSEKMFFGSGAMKTISVN